LDFMASAQKFVAGSALQKVESWSIGHTVCVARLLTSRMFMQVGAGCEQHVLVQAFSGNLGTCASHREVRLYNHTVTCGWSMGPA
jgi:hypothetical protein